VQHNNAEIIAIKLNNLLHRIDCKATMRAVVEQHGCHLKRIRRSKNWLLVGEQSQLVMMREQLPLWVAEAIDKALPKPSVSLASIIQANPSMTVNRLMVETGCTLTEARVAIDVAEDLG